MPRTEHDYDRFTHTEIIEASLERSPPISVQMHRYRAHPSQQSVRGGSRSRATSIA